MKIHPRNLGKMCLLLARDSLWGCVGQPPPPPAGGTTETSGSTTLTDGPGSTDDADSVSSLGNTSNPGSTSSSGGESNTTSTEGPFVFPDDPYDAYTQIDRHGAVEAGTAGILASQGLGFNPASDISLRDAYNASNPLEDAGGMWLDEIIESVTFFHANLDDDLMGLGITASVDEAVMQAGPVIVPDTIKYDPAAPTAHPNGRRLEDQVVDITLAAVLLDLSVHPLDLFATLPLNPVANDVKFGAEFPYLAAPHAP